jgi:2-oxoglutarate ferredoxin oxidoreductase subunit delta
LTTAVTRDRVTYEAWCRGSAGPRKMKGTGSIKRKKALVLNRIRCKGCGICVAFCPKGVLDLDEDDKVIAVREEACISCGLCEMRCPDFALTLEDRPAGEGGI